MSCLVHKNQIVTPEVKYVQLTLTQRDFLYTYIPKDKGDTSTLEMKKIISIFGLDEGISVEDMRAIRNSVVRFYSHLHRGLLIGGTERRLDDNMEAMQSITAVIDNCMYKKNPLSVL